MKEERWDLIKTIVDSALTLSGGAKAAYLSTACRENPEICEEIEALLHSIEESEEKQFMEPLRQGHKELVADLADELDKHHSPNKFIGKEIGPYRITEKLGIGGMGAVLKGERVDGEFHHTVAIKLIKQGVDSEENIRRFRMEREILARLHHPHIAQLYDGGVTKDGIPYLIMEYIDGVPVDRYCNEQRFTIRERLNLFKDICSAVQFAHTNLVVHRDLKAQNIYVTSEGEVKILDFGIAKLLDTGFTNVALLKTQPGQKFWTPQYAAPEQVRGEQITAKTDIYTLGVLLHKLLTDTYPLDLEGKNLSEVEQIIKQVEPLSPSQCFVNHPSKQEYARYRKTGAAVFTKKLKGDLDALVLKAIRKDPEFRYISVSQLLEDLERYQSGIPLVARKGTLKYRTAKFIHRHKTGLMATALFLLAAIAFTTFYMWRISEERDRAEMQAQKAEQVTQFMMGLFESNDPKEALGDTLIAPEILERGISRIEELTDQPEVQAQMLDVAGRIYESLGEYGKAQPLLEQALSLRKEVTGSNDPEVASSMNDIAQLLSKKGDYKPAEPYARQALVVRQRLLGEDHMEVAKSLNTLASLLEGEGNYNEAEPLFRESLAIRQKLLDEDHEDVITGMNNLALLLHLKGNYAEAESLFRKVVAVDRKQLDKSHPYLANDLNNLAFLLMDKGDYITAEQSFREALTIGQKVYGKQHPVITASLSGLARLYQLQGRYNEAEQFLRRAWNIDRRLFGDEHPYTISDIKNLGVLQYLQDEYEISEKTLRKALALFHKRLGAEHPRIATCLRALATLLRDEDHYTEAEHYYREALAMQRKLLAKYDLEITATLVGLSRLLIDQQRADEADPLARESLLIRHHTLPKDDWRVAETKVLLGACLTSSGNYQKAESLLVDNYTVIRNKHNIEERHRKYALERLIILFKQWKKPAQAKAYSKELAQVASPLQ